MVTIKRNGKTYTHQIRSDGMVELVETTGSTIRWFFDDKVNVIKNQNVSDIVKNDDDSANGIWKGRNVFTIESNSNIWTVVG